MIVGSLICFAFALFSHSFRQGLKPAVFHAHRDRLLSAGREELSDLIASCISETTSDGKTLTATATATGGDVPTSSSAEILSPHSRLFLGVIGCRHDSGRPVSRIIIEQVDNTSTTAATEAPAPTDTDLVVNLGVPGKKSSEIAFSNDLLPRAIEFTRAALIQGHDVLVQDGNACKDVAVGCMMVLLWCMMDDTGKRRPDLSTEIPRRESHFFLDGKNINLTGRMLLGRPPV